MSPVPVFASPFLLGFEELEALLERAARGTSNGYPPYNIERLNEVGDADLRLRIVLAVAGFSVEDLEVSVDGNQLIIRGRQNGENSSDFVHQGIAARQFQRTFVLADGLEITGARLENGLLSITVERPKPKRAVRRIAIESAQG